jgi:hypothetical protein
MRLNMKTQKILFSEILAVNFQNKGFLLYFRKNLRLFRQGVNLVFNSTGMTLSLEFFRLIYVSF